MIFATVTLANVLLLPSIHAQQDGKPGLYRVQSFLRTDSQPFQLSRWVVSGSESVRIGTTKLDSTEYEIRYNVGQLFLPAVSTFSADTVVVSYRYLPLEVDPLYRAAMPVEETSDSSLVPDSFRPPGPAPPVFDPFKDSALQRSGSFSRGIITGNRQDLTVESGFRLQLSGEILDGIQLRAMLTDENTPIQPEGTTQRLNEFDRVLIEMEARQGKATLGDFNLALNGNTLARFNRRLQGASLQIHLPQNDESFVGPGMVRISGATSRGIYRSLQLPAQEGVQGPYRLVGNNGEPFIIVIAGSERVYIDGQLLTRGESEDYIIDYASGEIHFTSNRLIREEHRINVEYEYTTNRFTRSILAAEGAIQIGAKREETNDRRGNVSFSILRESDGLSFSDELGLTDSEIEEIRLSGDALATVDGAVQIPFDAESPFTQYVKRDTLHTDGISYQIYTPVRSTDINETVYRVRFTRVESGGGSYERVGREINGILYEWVGPGNGTYIAKRILPQPVSQTLVDVRAGWKLLSGLDVFAEGAISRFDRNRISSLDDDDNSGKAFTTGIQLSPVPLRIARSDGALSGEATWQRRGASFQSFDRIRDIEFGRKWNISVLGDVDALVAGLEENVAEGSVEWTSGGLSKVGISGGSVSYGTLFTGRRASTELAWRESRNVSALYTATIIASNDSLTSEVATDGTWFLQSGEVLFGNPENGLAPSIGFEQENRVLRDARTDSLMSTSLGFTEIRPAIHWKRGPFEIAPGVSWRREQGVLGNELTARSVARTWQMVFAWTPSAAFRTNGTIGWREKRFEDSFRDSGTSQDGTSIVAKWDLRSVLLRRAIEINAGYEAITEKSPVLQEVYREVQEGSGQFIWDDFNGDGLRQVDEFRPIDATERFLGRYVLLLVPSDDLEPVTNVQARIRVGINPGRYLSDESTLWEKLVRGITGQTVIQITEKTTLDDPWKVYLLHPDVLRDEAGTINGRLRISQDVYLFRTHTAYGGSIKFLQLRSMNRFAAGVENRLINRWTGESRLRISPRVFAKLYGLYAHNLTESENFASRAYDITEREWSPEITVQWLDDLSTSFKGQLVRKSEENSVVDARITRLVTGLLWSKAERWQLRVNLEWGNTRLDDAIAGLAAYELTDGRGSGRSIIWNTGFQYAFNQTLRGSFYYDGRAPESAPVLHTVRAQVTASF